LKVELILGNLGKTGLSVLLKIEFVPYNTCFWFWQICSSCQRSFA